MSNTIKYFGADMGDQMHFGEYRKVKIQLVEIMTILTFSVKSKSCDKLLIWQHYRGRYGIISGLKGHEAGSKICKLYGKHCKWLASSKFSKVNEGSKTNDSSDSENI